MSLNGGTPDFVKEEAAKQINRPFVGLLVVLVVLFLCYLFYPNMGQVIATLLCGIFTFVVLLTRGQQRRKLK